MTAFDNHPCAAIAALLLAAAPAVAQSPAGPALPRDDAFVAPIHTMAPDERTGAEYGIWAAGPDYKASFHDGFAFYPVLGASRPDNLPLRWRTASVRVGEVELLVGATEERSTDWRFERTRGVVTERYDVRTEGVEQSFVIAALPGAAGDLVIEGALDTPLSTDPRGVEATGARAITFCDAAGAPIVQYGAAIAFDAAGRRTDVETAHDASTIRLIVPAAFVAAATLPITVDPLIRSAIVSSSGGALSICDIGRDDETDRLMVTYSRASSASDYDMWARLLDDDLTSVGNAFYDVTATWSNERSSVAFCGGADRWAIAHERKYSDTSAVTIYLHDRTSTTANSGTTRVVIPPGGRSDAAPTLGGTPGFDAGRRVFVAFRRDVTTVPRNTTDSAIYGAVLDCATATLTSSAVRIRDVASYDSEVPCISQVHGGGTTAAWLVVWQERYDAAGEPWRIRGVQVRQDGSIGNVRTFGSVAGNVHNLRPKVAGEAGRYAVVWTDRVNSSFYIGGLGHRVRVQIVRWDDGASSGYSSTPRTAVEDSYAAFNLGEGRALGFDRMTDSHWGVAWRHATRGLEVARIGYEGQVAERVVVAPDSATYGAASSPAVCFDDDARQFPLAWVTDGSLKRVHATALGYHPDAGSTPFGTGCRGTVRPFNQGSSAPYAGSQYFQLRLRNGQPSTPASLLVSSAQAASPIPLPLSAGCALLLDPSAGLFVVAASGASDTAGAWDAPLALPSSVQNADLYWQVVQVGLGGLSATDAVVTRIR